MLPAGEMRFELSVGIRRSPDDVFLFLRDKDKHAREPDSPVLVLEQTTPGPAGVGTRYREVVRMLPLVRGEIRSVVTRFEPGVRLEEEFEGFGMRGHLAYRFVPERGGTRLVQKETIYLRSPLLRAFRPAVERLLRQRLPARLEMIRTALEDGWEAPRPQPVG